MLSRLRHLAARLRALFQPASLDRDFNDELDTHTALLADDHVRRGLSRAEAERRARLEMGAAAQLREEHREVRSLPFFETLWRDTRYSLRSLRRDSGFTVFAILIAALGIGASTTIFGIVNALLLQPLPVRDPASLVWIRVAESEQDGDLSSETFKVNPFVEFRDQNRSFSGMAAYFAFYGIGDRKMTGHGEPERLTAVPVSQNFFAMLGVAPRMGRTFTEQESRDNLPVVLLNEPFWKRRFASDPNIVGRQLTLNNRAVTVIGVIPFDFGSVLAPGTRVDLYLPLPFSAGVNRMGNTLSAIGRLRPGVTLQQAQAEADVIIGPIGARHEREGLRVAMSPLDERVRGRIRPALFVLALAVGVVMLIVCANLSNLQLARASARQKEHAIRVALGAGRGRLIRQMVTESLLLSACAAALALGLAAAATRLMAGLQTINLPLRESICLDPAAFGFAAAAAALTGLILGLAPLLQSPSRAIHDDLKEANRGSSAGARHSWTRSALVVSEIAFACVLLVGSGLLIRSFLRVLDVNLGFRPDHAVAMRIDPKRENRNANLDEVLRLVRALPGVESAGLTDVLPLGSNRSWTIGAKDKVYSRTNPPPDVFVRIVSDGYFAAMGIPLRAGRDLDERDREGSKRVIVINETLARTLWPGENPLGKIIRNNGDIEVVGVVSDVRHIALEQDAGNEMYIPMRQTGDYSAVQLVARGSLAPSAMASSLRNALRPLEPNLPGNEFQVIGDLVDKSVSPRRFVAVLLAGFSAFALMLAALGIYGVISYSVSRQKQEIGIRMALGASAMDIQTRVLRQTLLLAGIGMAVGITASWMLARLLTGILYGVTGTDPATYAAMAAILLLAAAAGYLPARRASRTDPLTALRES